MRTVDCGCHGNCRSKSHFEVAHINIQPLSAIISSLVNEGYHLLVSIKPSLVEGTQARSLAMIIDDEGMYSTLKKRKISKLKI